MPMSPADIVLCIGCGFYEKNYNDWISFVYSFAFKIGRHVIHSFVIYLQIGVNCTQPSVSNDGIPNGVLNSSHLVAL